MSCNFIKKVHLVDCAQASLFPHTRLLLLKKYKKLSFYFKIDGIVTSDDRQG